LNDHMFDLSNSSSELDESSLLLVDGQETASDTKFSAQMPSMDQGRVSILRNAETVAPSFIKDIIPPPDDYSSAAFDRKGLVRTKYQAYLARICDLRYMAMGDGYSLNLFSEVDFLEFVKSQPRLIKGNLVLMDNGNLRAIWKDGQGTHLGMQFLGKGMVQYVIFKQRDPAQLISRVAGRDTFEGVRRQIESFELYHLLYQ